MDSRWKGRVTNAWATSVLYAAIGAVVIAASLHAEVRVTADFTDATMRVMRERPVSIDQLRKDGLAVDIRGRDEVELSVFVYVIEGGQVGKRWISYPMVDRPQDGRFIWVKFVMDDPHLPGTAFSREERIRPREPFQRGDVFLSADSVRGLLRDASMPEQWTGLLIAVSSQDRDAVRRVMTRPLFAAVERTGIPALDGSSK